MADNPKYEFDDWVGAVRTDPRNTDQLTVLQGYLGQSSEAGHIRVYSDEGLNSFIEVPEEAIVYSVKLTSAESSLGGSKLWLRADSVVTFGDPKLANRPKSTFLEGDIMQQYGAFSQPDTTQMAGFMAGQGDTTGRAGFTGGQPDTTGQGVQAMATNLLVFCGGTVQRSICYLNTCLRTQCSPVSCIRVLCGGGCQLGTRVPITTTRTITGPGGTITGPGGTIVQQTNGFTGQPDTTGMSGYYGTFNPYMY